MRTDLFGTHCALPDAPEPVFSAPFVDIERVASIVPLWPVSGPLLKGHTYIHLDKGVAGDAPVYAPARALVRTIAYYTQGGVAEYMVTFSVDCNVSFFFDHLKTLSLALSAVAPQAPASDSRASVLETQVWVEAGEQVGTTSGAGGVGAWDLGVRDMRVTNTFPNQARFETAPNLKGFLHAACPYTYYPPAQEAAYAARFGSADGRPVAGTDCRPAPREVVGSVQGMWFSTTDPSSADHAFTIAPEPGGQVRMAGKGWSLFLDGARDPATVRGAHCYAGNGRYVFLRLQNAETLDVAHGIGGCPGAFPAGYETVYR